MDDDENGQQPDPPSTATTTASKSIPPPPPPPPRRLSNSTSALDSSCCTTSPCIAHHKHYGSLSDYNSSSDRQVVVTAAAGTASSTATAGVLHHSRDSSTDSIQWRAANGSGVFGLLNAAERDTEIKRLVFTAINDGNRPMLADFLATYPSATEVLQLLLTTTYPNLDLFYQLDEEVANDAAELLGPSMAHLNAIQIACVLNEEDIALDLLDFVARVTEEIESRKVLYEFMGRVWGNGNTVLHLASFQGMSALVKRLLELGAAGKKRNDRNYRPVDCADDQVTTAMFSLVVDDEYGDAGAAGAAAEVREVNAADDARIDPREVEDGVTTATVLDRTSDPPCRDGKAAATSTAVTKGDQRVAEQEDGVLTIPAANNLTSSPANDVLLHGEPRSPTFKSSTATTIAPATAASSPTPPPPDLTTPIKLLAKQPRKSSLSNTNPTKDGETTTLPLPTPPQPRIKKSVAFSPETLLLNLCQHGAQTGDPEYLASITTCLDILASHNIDINSVRTPQKALTPLHQACTYGHADIARLLLSRRICVNVYDSEGWTPLHLDLVPRNGDGETPEDIVLEDRADEIIAVLTDLKARYPPPERTEPDGYELSETGFGDSESLDSLASIPADVADGDDARSAEDDTPDAKTAIDDDDKDRLNTKLTPLVLPWHGAANAGFATAGSDGKHVETLVVDDEPNLRLKVSPEATPSAAVFAVPPLQEVAAAPNVVALSETGLVQRVPPEAATPGQVAGSCSYVGESSPRVAQAATAAQLGSRIANISEDAIADNQDQIIPPPTRDFDRTTSVAAESSSLQQKQQAAASSPERRRRVVRPAQSSSRDPLTDQQQPPSTTPPPQSPTRIPAPPLSLSSPTRLSTEPSPPTTPLHRTTVSLIPVSTVSRSRGGSETDLAVEGGARRSDGTATQVMQSPDGKIISPTPPTTLPIRLPTGRRKDPPPKLRVAVGGGGPAGGASSAGVVATPITPRQTSDGGAANMLSSYSVSQPPRASSSIASSPADAVRPKLSRRGSLSVQTVVRGSPSTSTHEPHPPPASISSSSALAPQSPAGSSTNNAVPTTPTTRSRLSRRFSITRAESVAVDVPFILRSDLAQQASLQSPSSPQQSQRQDPPIHRLYPIRPAGGGSSSSPSSSSSALSSSSTPAPPTCTLVRTATLSAPFASGRTKSKHYHYATTTVLPPQAPPPPIAQSSSSARGGSSASPTSSSPSSSPSSLSSPIPRAPPQPMWKRQSASPRNNNNNAAGGGLPRPPPPSSLSEPLYAPDVPAGLVRKGSVRERAAAINSATAR
ncbi:hypothetical protein HDU90_005836 [Geranomyces variabilis]|nr:hypothetical protein HDU90_005836 [Geranomyces variabilis]